MKSRLSVRGNEVPFISGDSENLYVYLSDVNSDSMIERIGTEKIINSGAKVDVRGMILFASSTKGQKFKMAAGSLQGGRYLLSETPHGQPVAALNWTTAKNETFISNIFVRIDFRRQGLASAIVDLAKEDFSKLKVDSNMTLRGAEFFGYGKDPELKLNLSRFKPI